MYSTCLFCNAALGRNESIEAFPIGRRIAFDAAKGRLWVVCPKCARWNLSPFESRWEAIEEAERAYRDTRVRVSTEHIGLAKLREGLELVRIGEPQRPEFAAWRYGDVFRKRMRKEAMWAIGLTVVGGAGLLTRFGGAEVALGLSTIGFSAQVAQMARTFSRARKLRLTVRTGETEVIRLTAWDASRTAILREHGKPWVLGVKHRDADLSTRVLRRVAGPPDLGWIAPPYTILHGDMARRTLATLLPTVNHHGGDKKDVTAAVEFASMNAGVVDAFVSPTPMDGDAKSIPTGPLGRLTAAHRLGLEMLLHEADERRALEGELHELEQRWREADAIAAIADTLLLPAAIETRLRAMSAVTSSHTRRD